MLMIEMITLQMRLRVIITPGSNRPWLLTFNNKVVYVVKIDKSCVSLWLPEFVIFVFLKHYRYKIYG